MINKVFKDYAIAMTIMAGTIIGPFAAIEYEHQKLKDREESGSCYFAGLMDGMDAAARVITTMDNRNTDAVKTLLRASATKRFNRPRGGPCNGN